MLIPKIIADIADYWRRSYELAMRGDWPDPATELTTAVEGAQREIEEKVLHDEIPDGTWRRAWDEDGLDGELRTRIAVVRRRQSQQESTARLPASKSRNDQPGPGNGRVRSRNDLASDTSVLEYVRWMASEAEKEARKGRHDLYSLAEVSRDGLVDKHPHLEAGIVQAWDQGRRDVTAGGTRREAIARLPIVIGDRTIDPEVLLRAIKAALDEAPPAGVSREYLAGFWARMEDKVLQSMEAILRASATMRKMQVKAGMADPPSSPDMTQWYDRKTTYKGITYEAVEPDQMTVARLLLAPIAAMLDAETSEAGTRTVRPERDEPVIWLNSRSYSRWEAHIYPDRYQVVLYPSFVLVSTQAESEARNPNLKRTEDRLRDVLPGDFHVQAGLEDEEDCILVSSPTGPEDRYWWIRVSSPEKASTWLREDGRESLDRHPIKTWVVQGAVERHSATGRQEPDQEDMWPWEGVEASSLGNKLSPNRAQVWGVLEPFQSHYGRVQGGAQEGAVRFWKRGDLLAIIKTEGGFEARDGRMNDLTLIEVRPVKPQGGPPPFSVDDGAPSGVWIFPRDRQYVIPLRRAQSETGIAGDATRRARPGAESFADQAPVEKDPKMEPPAPVASRLEQGHGTETFDGGLAGDQLGPEELTEGRRVVVQEQEGLRHGNLSQVDHRVGTRTSYLYDGRATQEEKTPYESWSIHIDLDSGRDVLKMDPSGFFTEVAGPSKVVPDPHDSYFNRKEAPRTVWQHLLDVYYSIAANVEKQQAARLRDKKAHWGELAERARTKAIAAFESWQAWRKANPGFPLKDHDPVKERIMELDLLGSGTATEGFELGILRKLPDDWRTRVKVGDPVKTWIAMKQESGWWLASVEGDRAAITTTAPPWDLGSGNPIVVPLWMVSKDHARAAQLAEGVKPAPGPATGSTAAPSRPYAFLKALADAGWKGGPLYVRNLAHLLLGAGKHGYAYLSRGIFTRTAKRYFKAHGVDVSTHVESGAWSSSVRFEASQRDQESASRYMGNLHWYPGSGYCTVYPNNDVARPSQDYDLSGDPAGPTIPNEELILEFSAMLAEALKEDGKTLLDVGEELILWHRPQRVADPRVVVAEEGCHDTEFDFPGTGRVRVVCGQKGRFATWHNVYIGEERYGFDGRRWSKNQRPPAAILEAIKDQGITTFGS